MENLKIKDLKLVSLLSRFHSLRAIARHLDMEPQNLSKRFDHIEYTLGHTLFVRSPKGISVTTEGLHVIDVVTGVLRNLNVLDGPLETASPYAQSLNVCSRGFIINYLCPFLIRSFQNTTVGLRFMDQSPEALEKSARDNIVNVAYHFGEANLGKKWQKTKIGTIPYVIVVRENHPLPEKIQPKDLKKFRMVGGCYIENGQFVLTDLPRIQGTKTPRGFDSENSIYSKHIVLETSQFAVLPIVAVLNELRAGSLRILDVESHKMKSRDVFVEFHMDQVLNKNASLILKHSRQALAELQSFV